MLYLLRIYFLEFGDKYLVFHKILELILNLKLLDKFAKIFNVEPKDLLDPKLSLAENFQKMVDATLSLEDKKQASKLFKQNLKTN